MMGWYVMAGVRVMLEKATAAAELLHGLGRTCDKARRGHMMEEGIRSAVCAWPIAEVTMCRAIALMRTLSRAQGP